MDQAPRGLVDVREVLQYLDRDRYMGKAEAAEYLSLSIRTLEAKKEIPRFQLEGDKRKGGKVLFRKIELDRWMEQHRVRGGEQQDLSRLADAALRAVCNARK